MNICESYWAWTLCWLQQVDLHNSPKQPFHFLVQCLITWFRSRACHMVSGLHRKVLVLEKEGREEGRPCCVGRDSGEKVPARLHNSSRREEQSSEGARLFCDTAWPSDLRAAQGRVTDRKTSWLFLSSKCKPPQLQLLSYYTNYDTRPDHVITKENTSKSEHFLIIAFHSISFTGGRSQVLKNPNRPALHYFFNHLLHLSLGNPKLNETFNHSSGRCFVHLSGSSLKAAALWKSC